MNLIAFFFLQEKSTLLFFFSSFGQRGEKGRDSHNGFLSLSVCTHVYCMGRQWMTSSCYSSSLCLSSIPLSQVISLSGIKSLLKRLPSRSNEFSSFSSSSSSSSWMLDLASQHKLHAVASTWEPEQILTELTNAPSPEINFAIYLSPVPIVFKGRGERQKARGGGGEEEEVDHHGQWDSSSDDTEEEEKPDGEGKKPSVKKNITGIAISGWGSLIVIPPSSSSSSPSSSSSLVEIPSREMRGVCGVLIAQVRSFFSLPSTLVDYFHARRIAKDKNDEEEVILENESQDTPHEEFSSTMIRDETQKKVLLQSLSVHLNVKKIKNQANEEEAEEEELARNSVVMIWRRTRDEKSYIRGGEEEEEKAVVVVVAEHSPTGVGLWELWRLALPVYVHLVQLAVTNIRSLQRILENQTELAVPPHVGEALEVGVSIAPLLFLFFHLCSPYAHLGRVFLPIASFPQTRPLRLGIDASVDSHFINTHIRV